MNEDILQGKWKQIQGDVKKWWGKLTDDDLKYVEGSREKLVGLLQERYGYNRQAAQAQIAEFLEDLKTRRKVEQTQ